MTADRGRQQEEIATGRYKQTTEGRLILGGFALMLLVGGGLTALTLGMDSAIIAVTIIALAVGLLLLIYVAFGLLEVWLRQ